MSLTLTQVSPKKVLNVVIELINQSYRLVLLTSATSLPLVHLLLYLRLTSRGQYRTSGDCSQTVKDKVRQTCPHLEAKGEESVKWNS